MKIIREFGPNEMWYYKCEHFTTTNLSLIIHFKEVILREDIVKVLSLLQDEFPVFRYHIEILKNSRPAFAEEIDYKPIPLKVEKISIGEEGDQVDEIKIREKLYKIAENESSTKISLSRCLFLSLEFKNTSESAIIFTSPHFIVDGVSLVHIANFISKYIKQQKSDSSYHNENFPPDLYTLYFTPFRQLISLIPFIKQQLLSLIKSIIFPSFYFSLNLPLENRVTKSKYFTCSEKLSQSLISLTKNRSGKEKLSINDILLSVYAKSIADLYPSKEMRFSIGCPVNIRPFFQKYLPIKDDLRIGPFVTVNLYHVKKDLIPKKQLKNFKDSLLFLLPLNYLTKKSADESHKTMKKISEMGPGRIALTNIGYLERPENVKYLGFAGSLNIYGHLLLTCHSFQDNQLHFLISWIEPLFTKEEIENLSCKLIQNLENLVSSKPV